MPKIVGIEELTRNCGDRIFWGFDFFSLCVNVYVGGGCVFTENRATVEGNYHVILMIFEYL